MGIMDKKEKQEVQQGKEGCPKETDKKVLGMTDSKPQNKKIDEAFAMIVEAYNQAPFDPSINDSLGFALYNLGYYAMALPYLERAAEFYPSSAVISSHLGDIYWVTGRKNEARFQWQHALRMKDESGELNIDETKNKIANGITSEPQLTYDKEKIEAAIRKIRKPKKSIRVVRVN